MLEFWNDTARDYPDVCLHDLAAARLARDPTRAAVRFRGEELSMAALDRHAHALAQALVQRGVGPGARVAVCVERDLTVAAAFLAVLRTGAAYVPLEPGDPPARLADLLEDAEPTVILTQERVRSRLPAAADVVLLEEVAAGDFVTESGVTVRPTDLAYVIFTSGSTGKPKGAMNAHRGVVNRLVWMREHYGIDARHRVLQKTPFGFDVSGWELWLPLISGAVSVVAEPGGHRDPTYLARLIADEGVTHAHFVPSMLRLFLEDAASGRCTSLQQVICSGEELTPKLQQQFFARLPSCRLDNLYGPTEAAIDVSHWRCDPGDGGRTVPIGRPVANTQLYVLDDALEPVAPGVAGELHIGGVQVGRGYLHRAALTAARFVPDPFRAGPDARLYRTGDLARHREDGVLEFLGRLDDQVKVRGVRIELGELDAALADAPGVAAAVSAAKDYGDGDRRLVAYVVPAQSNRSSAGPDDAALLAATRTHLKAGLPEALQPAAIVVLPDLPLGPNGKVDRRALPMPSRDTVPAPSRPAPAGGAVTASPEALLDHLLQLWRDVLKRADVGPHQPFFELGGNSLLAAQLVNRVQRRLGAQIFVVALFEAPTAAAFAAFLAEHYAAAVQREFGVAAPRPPASTAGVSLPTEAPLGAADVARFRQELAASAADPGTRAVREAANPPAVFILSTHRSGTTLLRAMLAGHPQLFGAPELQLLGFETMAARRAAYSGAASLWLEGALRAVMEIFDCAAADAQRRVAAFEGEGHTTQRFFAQLQEWVAPRLLVDKSPTYALDRAALHRAEAFFAGARYVHLVRHPAAMVQSAREFHMEQVWPFGSGATSPAHLAELVWTVSHQNIVDFLAAVPSARQCRVRFEDLTQQPEPSLRAISACLGLAFDEALLHPYAQPERKMLDGIHPESMPMGDTKFHGYGRIEPGVAERWRETGSLPTLGEPTWQLAESLGYRRVDGPAGPTGSDDAAPVGGRREGSLQQQRARRRRHRQS